MGFPSPAQDYVESCITIDTLCQFNANCRVLETSTGYAVVDVSVKPHKGCIMIVSHFGRVQFAVCRGDALVMCDGEAVEGEALNDVEVKGVVTFLINRAPGSEAYDLPVM